MKTVKRDTNMEMNMRFSSAILLVCEYADIVEALNIQTSLNRTKNEFLLSKICKFSLPSIIFTWVKNFLKNLIFFLTFEEI